MDETITVLPPPAALAGSIVCCVWRRIEPGGNGGGWLESSVPANVYGCVNVIAAGAVRISEGSEWFPSQFITGPFTAPLPTQATAPLRSLSIVVYPWVLEDWFGTAVPSMVNAIHDLRFIPEDSLWHKSVGSEILAAVDHPELLDKALAGFATLGSRLPERISPESLISCMLSAGSVASAAKMLDLSERQFERHFKRYLGLSPKLWLRIKRFEDALVSIAKDQDVDVTRLGGIAAETGFSDQAHMSREFRAISGATPLSLRKGLHQKSPGFWAFQPANVGFLQDSQICEK